MVKKLERPVFKDFPGDQEVTRRPLTRSILLDGLESNAGVLSGSVDQELLLQNEYLVTENRILKNQNNGRLRLTGPERINLAEIGRRLGRKALRNVAQIVRPETILGWHRKAIAMKFDGSKGRSSVGRAPTVPVIEDLVLPPKVPRAAHPVSRQLHCFRVQPPHQKTAFGGASAKVL